MRIPFIDRGVWRAALLSIAVTGSLRAAEPRVELEVVTEQGFVGTETRAWSEMLNQAGFSTVRIKSGVKDSPSLQTTGTANAPSYRVVGVLTSGNQLLLPKGRFGLGDRALVEAWVRKLREGGEDAINIKPAAFGLLPKQLVAAHEALSAPVQFATRDKPPREVARQIADRISLKFVSDDAGQRALAAGEPVADELQGLSSGTALAAILRPLGLALVPEKNVPEKSGSDVRLRIAASLTVKEQWPVGWPPKGNPSETLPDLFKFLTVEIEKTPVSESITAIAQRVKAPLLLDHNAIARHEVDLTAKVSLPKSNTFYARALERLLFQAKLKYELRVDEAGKPLLWVTTQKE